MGITRQQALECCSSDDLIGMGMEADSIRRLLHPEGVASYVVDRVVDLTTSSFRETVAGAVDLGATGLVLGVPASSLPAHNLAWIEQTLHTLRTRFPAVWLHGLSATVIVALASQEDLSADEVLRRLRAAGLGSLSGSDAGILDNAVQSTAAARCSSTDWIAVHRAAHRLGMPSTAAMLFGAGETPEHRVNHLEAIDRLQQETGGFVAFRPVAFQPAVAGVRGFEEATAVEYLRTLAIARMMLDNIPNIEADWATQGLKVLQMTLRFGANDVGSVMPGEALTTPDGTTEEDLRRIIRGAGLRPVQRDTPYRTMFPG